MKTKNETKIFAPSTGGAEKMCKEFQIPFLGSIPLDPRVAKCCDDGVSFIDKYPDSPASKIYLEIIDSTLSHKFHMRWWSIILILFNRCSKVAR